MPSLPAWGGVAASGFVSLVVGVAFVHLLLAHEVRLLGVALAADLAFQGVTALAFGLALEVEARAASSPTKP
jgi:uncharacterized membrane protein HdeD (DUF308 family)